VSEDLPLLIGLQKLDLEIDKTLKKKEELTYQIQALEKELVSLQEKLTDKERELKNIRRQVREKEKDIEEMSLVLAKHEEEKYKVKSQGEFTAIEREIAQVERKKEKTEDLLLELMEREEELISYLPSFKRETEEKRKSLGEEKQILSKSLENLVHKEEKLRSERKKKVSQLNSLLLGQYEQLRRTKDGLAIAAVKNGVCQGCNVGVPPSLISRIRRGEIVYCESCSRILYVAEEG